MRAFVRWFEPAMDSILHREYNNYYMGDGAIIEQNDFLIIVPLLISRQRDLQLRDFCD